jgi:hypothetical protein
MSLRDDLRVMRGYEDVVGHDHSSTHARAHGYWTTEREHHRTEGLYGDSVEAPADRVERQRRELEEAEGRWYSGQPLTDETEYREAAE